MPDAPELPVPRWWPAPITLEQYLAFTPEKLELSKGYLVSGDDAPEARLRLLALLLTNCGLEEAVTLAGRDDWREALERSYPDW